MRDECSGWAGWDERWMECVLRLGGWGEKRDEYSSLANWRHSSLHLVGSLPFRGRSTPLWNPISPTFSLNDPLPPDTHRKFILTKAVHGTPGYHMETGKGSWEYDIMCGHLYKKVKIVLSGENALEMVRLTNMNSRARKRDTG
ncbi:hypothetical protein Pcinc_008479 [Petrolisthes cinctipes]|uniref:Uncharacterized protein n=1 Tax=Petrolisthes cinctipes TaxID=88211 RepID=A0AAE1KXH6_PETCI|nr:hypothetical protein Pcinc_008479 [Petrolisthes cinctipes]